MSFLGWIWACECIISISGYSEGRETLSRGPSEWVHIWDRRLRRRTSGAVSPCRGHNPNRGTEPEEQNVLKNWKKKRKEKAARVE